MTVLDTHDGIGVADVDATAAPAARPAAAPAHHALVETIHARSRGESRQASGDAARNVDAHQINCTFYDALGRRDDEYLVARAIQCFVPGIPQIYYVGLLAGTNDMALLRRTRVGRDINRHSYSAADVAAGAGSSRSVRRCSRSCASATRIRLSRGRSERSQRHQHRIAMTWKAAMTCARLEVDLAAMRRRSRVPVTKRHGP